MSADVMMRALIFDGPGQLRLDRKAVPEPGLGEVVVRVCHATICGTDVRILQGRKTREVRRGVPIGHECAGVVHAVGEGVTAVQRGDRVGVCVVVSCGQCAYCEEGHENLCASRYTLGYRTDGAFADFMLIPAEAVARGNLFVLPESVSFECAPVLEPAACCLNGQEEMGLRDGSVGRLVIFGAGPIGLLHLLIARARADAPLNVTMIEPQPHRRAIAKSLGVDVAYSPDEFMADGTFDAAIVAVGVSSLVDQSMRSVRKGGKVNLFAGFDAGVSATLDPNVIHYGQLHVSGASESRRCDYAEALAMVVSGALDLTRVVTHRFGLDAYEEAFRVAADGSALKVAFDVADDETEV